MLKVVKSEFLEQGKTLSNVILKNFQTFHDKIIKGLATLGWRGIETRVFHDYWS